MIHGFGDELEKLGAEKLLRRPMLKHAGADDAPHGLFGGNGDIPTPIEVKPDQAHTRLSTTPPASTGIIAGALGEVTGAKDPIDRQKFNRAYETVRR